MIAPVKSPAPNLAIYDRVLLEIGTIPRYLSSLIAATKAHDEAAREAFETASKAHLANQIEFPALERAMRASINANHLAFDIRSIVRKIEGVANHTRDSQAELIALDERQQPEGAMS